MHKARLEAFSDAVIAIIMTIMVLELKVPHSVELSALRPLIPVFLSYVLSFVILGIWWNNHHHLLQACVHVDGRVLWANMHLLFWLSLFPFCTAWMGENHFAAMPVALYGVVFFGAAIAYYFLVRSLIRRHGADSALARAIGRDRKGFVSGFLYLAAIPLAFVHPWISLGLFVVVAIIWLVPDTRLERELIQAGRNQP